MAVAAGLVALGCLGPVGPSLPTNVGTTHRGERPTRPEPVEDEPAPEAIPVGTTVWANYRDTGYHFRGTVIERREDQHRVLYDDGGVEWVGADALLPDHLANDAEIDVRPNHAGEFASGRLGRRLGRAVYVRMANGDERWTSLAHVRFERGSRGAPTRRSEAEVPAELTEGEVGSSVMVNYQSQGLRFAATVTARNEQGRLHVVYLDGESEWVAPNVVGPDDLIEGAVVHVRRRWDPPDWVRGRVRGRVGEAFEVELDDGGFAWTTLMRLRAPIEQAAAPPPSPDPPADAAE